MDRHRESVSVHGLGTVHALTAPSVPCNPVVFDTGDPSVVKDVAQANDSLHVNNLFNVALNTEN